MKNLGNKITFEAYFYEASKDEEGDLMLHMKQKGMIPQDADTDTGKYGHSREEEETKAKKKKDEDEERRIDPKCWKGYHKVGTKIKGGKRVNNCVKNK